MLAQSLQIFIGLVLSVVMIGPALGQSLPSNSDDVFIAGEVKRPGKIPFKDAMTVKKAISLAEGTTLEAAPSRAVIFRTEPATGKRREVRVDLEVVMSGKEQDVELKPGDIIIIPSKSMKKRLIDTPPIPTSLPLNKEGTTKG